MKINLSYKKNVTMVLGLTALMYMASSHSIAGTGYNGGIGIVCRNTSGTITSAELLDLVEAKEVDHLSILSSLDSVETQIGQAIERLYFEPATKAISKVHQEFGNKFVNTGEGFELPNPDDFNPRIQKKGCKYEVIALFDDEKGEIRLDKEIYQRLSKTHKAALALHEFVYRRARYVHDGEINSDATRLVVGILFSKDINKSNLYEVLSSAIKINEVKCDLNLYKSGLYGIEKNQTVTITHSYIESGSSCSEKRVAERDVRINLSFSALFNSCINDKGSITTHYNGGMKVSGVAWTIVEGDVTRNSASGFLRLNEPELIDQRQEAQCFSR